MIPYLETITACPECGKTYYVERCGPTSLNVFLRSITRKKDVNCTSREERHGFMCSSYATIYTNVHEVPEGAMFSWAEEIE